MHGGHVIKSWSTNQAVIAVSSGEAEYYSLVKAASMSIGMQSISADLGIQFEEAPMLKSDASAAIGIASRVGLGKIRHIEVNQLWLQSKISKGELMVEKVGTQENLADMLTKSVDSKTMQYHVSGINAEYRTDRHPLLPKLDQEKNSAVEMEEDE